MMDSIAADSAGTRPPDEALVQADEDGLSGPCVVCQQRTGQVVRPMGLITDPLWCCHAHDDRTIVRAWIHQLPEWHQLQADCPSACTTCQSPCHCARRAPRDHRCACWPPTEETRAPGAATPWPQ